MKILFLALIFPVLSHAGIIGTIGGSIIGGYQSDAKNAAGKNLLDATGTLGLTAEVEFPILGNFLTAHVGLLYSRMGAKTQYFDPKTAVTAVDQESQISNTDGFLGARVRFINFKHLKIFLGGGGVFGNAKLEHDAGHYREQNGGNLPTGFKEIEEVSKWGHYLETGVDFVFTKTSTLRFSGRLITTETERFETLNNKSVEGTYFATSIMYSHYFDKFISIDKK